MLAEALAVIPDGDHDGVARLAALVQKGEKPADLLIHECDLGIVGRDAVEARPGERGAGVVGIVRVVEVNPREERCPVTARGLEPRKRGSDDDVTGAVDGKLLVDDLRPRAGEVIVVGIEAAVEPEALRKHIRRNECARSITPGPKLFRGGCRTVRQSLASVDAHAVLGRFEPGEEGGVRGQRHRAWRVCRLEADAGRRERVELRRERIRIAVAPEPIGPGGIERQKEDARTTTATAANMWSAARVEHGEEPHDRENAGGQQRSPRRPICDSAEHGFPRGYELTRNGGVPTISSTETEGRRPDCREVNLVHRRNPNRVPERAALRAEQW